MFYGALNEYFKNCNSLVQNFLSLSWPCRNQGAPQSICLMITTDQRPSSEHDWRYNALTATEADAFVRITDVDHMRQNNIVIHRNTVLKIYLDENLQQISVSHKRYDAVRCSLFL